VAGLSAMAARARTRLQDPAMDEVVDHVRSLNLVRRHESLCVYASVYVCASTSLCVYVYLHVYVCMHVRVCV
jgi:hypothetical protein